MAGFTNGQTTSRATRSDGLSCPTGCSHIIGKVIIIVVALREMVSRCRTQEEMAHTCRGTVNLAGAFIDTIDSCNFVITNGPSQVFHLRASNEIERQRWVTALELAKAKAIKMLESGMFCEE